MLYSVSLLIKIIKVLNNQCKTLIQKLIILFPLIHRLLVFLFTASSSDLVGKGDITEYLSVRVLV